MIRFLEIYLNNRRARPEPTAQSAQNHTQEDSLMPKKQIEPLSDQEILDDILASQKHITEIYNAFSNECKNNTLESDTMNILREEHNIGLTEIGRAHV